MDLKKQTALIGASILMVACSTNPFTGKKTLALVPNSQIFPAAFAQYNEVINKSEIEKGTADAQMITRVGQKIAKAAERWLKLFIQEFFLWLKPKQGLLL